jgi:hypothetical protein
MIPAVETGGPGNVIGLVPSKKTQNIKEDMSKMGHRGRLNFPYAPVLS